MDTITIPIQILRIMGWANVLLVLLAIGLHVTIGLYKLTRNHKSPLAERVNHLSKISLPFLRSYHPVFGSVIVFYGLIHGYYLLFGVEVHSGYLVWTLLALLGMTGILLYRKIWPSKRSFIRATHKILMYALIPLLIYHILKMKSIL